MKLTDYSCAYAGSFLCLLAIAVASPTYGGRIWTKREVQCQESKIVVNVNNRTTSIKIITDSGDTLFNVDNTNTVVRDLDHLLTFTTSLFFPEDGHVLFGNNSNYYIVKNPLDNGIDLKIIDTFNETIFKKEIVGSNEGLTKTDVKCTHLTGFKVVVEPSLDVNHRDGYNMTALVWATVLGEDDVAKDLVKRGARLDLGGIYGSIPLVAAIIPGHAEMVEFLIQHGADVNQPAGAVEITPLHMAADKGRIECARILLKHGALVDSANSRKGVTPLHVAVYEGHDKFVKEIVSRGANVNARTKTNLTALHIAALFGREDVLHFLVESGADVNAKDKEGATPLMKALTHIVTEDVTFNIVKHLIEHHNADVNVKDNKGNTVLSLATAKGFKKIEDYLKAHGAQ